MNQLRWIREHALSSSRMMVYASTFLILVSFAPLKCASQTIMPTVTGTFGGVTDSPVLVFDCPNNTLTNNLVVNYTEPRASNGDESLTVTCQPESGEEFDEGVSTVECTVADATGIDTTVICTFNVTVDTTPPNATFSNCPNNTLTNTTEVIYQEPTASDGEESLAVSCRLQSGPMFREGDTIVLCTAADEAGNVAAETCSFIVTVDSVSPNATFFDCPNDTLSNATEVIYQEPTASDGVESLTVTCLPESGSPFPENDRIVVCTAADKAGNVAAETCSFTVTVDTIRPNATFFDCPNDTLSNAREVIYQEPTASDGDKRLTVTCRPKSGSTFFEKDTIVVCTAADEAGNVAAESCMFNVTVDVDPPVLSRDTCPADSQHYADFGTTSTSVTWRDPIARDTQDPDPVVTCSPVSSSRFEIGTSTVTCTATDAAGNAANQACTFDITVSELNAPVINNITGVTNESMVVTWTSQDRVENFTVEYRGTFEDTSTESATVPGSEKSFTLTGLRPGETYTMKVIGESGLAQAESQERKQTTELNEPTITAVSSVEMRSMVLEWSPPPNSVVESYNVTYSGTVEDTATRNKMLSGTMTSLSLDGLLPGETYKLRVIASSGSEDSGEVSAESEEWQETTVPMSVDLQETGSTVSSITVQWLPPDDPQSRLTPVIEYYTILCSEGNADQERIDYTADLIVTSCTNLPTSGEEYTLTVESHSGDKTSSSNISIIALPNGVDLFEEEPTTTSISASWSFPDGQADIFNISCREGTPSPDEIVIGDPPEERYQASCRDLPNPGGTYGMTVYVISRGKQSNSSHIQLTALPESVTNLIVTSYTTSEITLSWTISNCLHCVFTSFNASRSGGREDKIIQFARGEVDYMTSFDSLVPGREYTFYVTAQSGDKESAVESVTQRTNPSQISGFVSNSTTKTSIIVSWNEPSGDKDRYVITISPEDGTLADRDLLDTTATFQDLSPGKRYSVSVVTSSSNSSSTPFEADLETKPDTSGPVTNLVISNVEFNKVTINFGPPDNPRGTVTGYRISYSGSWKDKTDPEDVHTVTLDDLPKIINHLLPGYEYTFTFQAINGAGLGEAKSETVTTKTAPPDSSTTEPELGHESPTTTTISVPFLETYFSHDNGELLNYTIIVAQEGADANSISERPSTWLDVRDDDPIPPYQAFTAKGYPFPPPDPSGRRKRQTREERIVIGNEDCQSVSGYCNGPLRDDTSYVYLFRVWNEAGYADTPFSKPIRTKNDTSLELGLGVGLTLSILFIVCIALALLVIRRRRQLSRERRPTMDYQNRGFEEDLIPVRRVGNSRAIRLEDFPDHYRMMKADSEYRFSEEYEELRPIGRNQPAEACVSDANRSKNRFTNILPYDHSRVKLKQVDDEEGSDYINANFMPGYNSPREFIACQGPLPGTEDDMWRLVWEQKVSIIVMVTQLIEKGRVKCHKYWPSIEKPVYFGEILVALLSEKKLKHWTVRQFELEKGDRKRKVQHFNFTAWPDHGVPENTEGILQFVRTIRNQIPPNGRPTLVHCSAGVGRTGTFICLDRLILHMKEHDYVDVFGIVSEMRMQRNFMVQTEDQYIFIHECIMNLLQGQRTNGEPLYENTV